VTNEDLLRAACRGKDPEMFFRKEDERAAKALCHRCPVRDSCLNTALNAELVDYLAGLADGRRTGIKLHGVFGGWTAQERTGIIYRRAQQALGKAST
jgi:WhiB family redox-sensing transcriptional regulator